jgi:Zn-dependent protease with chaperone function
VIYNNLIYLIVVIFILSTNSVPDIPQLSPGITFLLFAAKGLFFWFLVRLGYGRKRVSKVSEYFKAEQKFSILAIGSVAVDVYVLDCQYYFAGLPFTDNLPILVSLGGILLFFSYLCLVWAGARESYSTVFGRSYSTWAFLGSNILNNIPIILPWLLLSLLFDLLLLLPFPVVSDFLKSSWGEPLFFLTFFVLLAVSFPEIIVRLWKCRPLPDGPVRDHIENFCRKHKLRYANVMLWPLFEGQAVTAGIMGLVRRFRYLLITPALLDNLTRLEVDAVMAHEIGHVKRYHLQLYVFILLGFSLIAQLGSYLFMYLLLKSSIFYSFTKMLGKQTDSVLIFLSTLALLIFLIVYFRFIFGFFMRNFERQADIHALTSLGGSGPIVSALEKVAWLSGNIRDLPSWHHFGIGQRVDFLHGCESDPEQITRHHRKVYGTLLLYLAMLCVVGFSLWKMPSDLLQRAPLEHLAKLYTQKTIEEPANPLWFQLLGDMQQGRKQYSKAVDAYERALILASDHPDILNNLAWLLLTAEDEKVLNPVRALMLARTAANLKPAAYILDTLATAYYANGFTENAIRVGKEAVAVADPERQHYYLQQLEKYSSGEI